MPPRPTASATAFIAPRMSAALTRKAVEMALADDHAALRRCLDRTMAPRRDRAVELSLPPIDSATDILSAIKVVSGAVGRGAITPGEGFAMSQMIESFLRAIDVSDFESRLRELEKWRATSRHEAEPQGRDRAAQFDSPPRQD